MHKVSTQKHLKAGRLINYISHYLKNPTTEEPQLITRCCYNTSYGVVIAK